MPISHEVVYGGLLENNTPPKNTAKAVIQVPGTFKDRRTSNVSRSSFGLTEEILSKHILLVGGTGCGKTNLFYHMVKQIKAKLTPNDVVLIFDSKGDFYKKFYSKGDVVIGNSIQYRKSSERWSIYKEVIADGKDPVSVTQNTQEICKSLFADLVERNSSNPFFPMAARDLFASIIIALIKSGVVPNNEDLKRYIDTKPVEDLRELLGQFPDLASVASYIGGNGSQSQGVLSEMYSVTRDVLTGVFADAGDFSMREFVRKKCGKIAFVEYDLSIGDVLAPIYTLLFDLALKEALGRTATQGNVYLIVDELKLLPNLRHLEDGINFGRGLGVKILAGLQSIDQLNANYSNEKKAKNAVSGFSSVFAFHQNDYATREYICQLMGKNMILESFPEANGSIHYEKREGYVVEDWDLTDLIVGEAIVSLPSVAPFRFRFDEFV
ncbi:Type IV secretion-system coupling protein DNA-binding domain-containing protein [Ruminococcaceae bacterium YRB3002]|nr:Type IV secretion-system coupling protein DNA-binding domain-containing protein [Ruminococcaceae bacterium YRB3002]